MKPKLSDHAAQLAQLKRELDRTSEGVFGRLAPTEDKELEDLFVSFNNMCRSVENRVETLRDQNLQLAISVSRIEKLLDASIDGIAFISTELAFQFVNRRFYEILGIRVGSLNKKSVIDGGLLWKETVRNPHRLRRVLTPPAHENHDGTHDVVDEVIELVGTEPRYAQVYGAPVLDDDGVFAGRIISLHDNTREIELDRLKTEFISVVSHELRTPLTSIKGYTDLMLSGATGEVNEVQREFLGILQDSANRLGNLINDILDLSRIDSGRVEIKHEPVDYIKVVGDLVRLMKASADEKEISLDVSFPQHLPMVSGDLDKISQVVSNLLSNAIKYTPEGGWIKVLIEVTGETTVRTCVSDSGIGISPADQKRLFQKFFRADNSLTRQAGGTGLGLVIVKSIVEMLGGAIWVQSDTGKGSKFFFTLPLHSDRKHVDPATILSDQELATPFPDRGLALVLVVDNSSFVRETVQHSLHRRGYGVICAGTSEDALEKARMHKPEVILLDVMMNKCSGFEILSMLRADPATQGLPVIAFSMHGESTDNKIALGAISFTNETHGTNALIESFDQGWRLINEPPSVLIITFGPFGDERAKTSAQLLIGAHINTAIVEGANAAITTIVRHMPHALLVLSHDGEEQQLFNMLLALKSVKDLASIPVVVTSSILEDETHFHLGDADSDVRSAVEYIGEQLAAVLRANSYRASMADRTEESLEPGILRDNS